MNVHLVYLRRSLLTMIIGATLSACGAAPPPVTSLPSSAPSSAAPPSIEASAPASPSAAPSEVASPAPVASESATPAASVAPSASASPEVAEGVLPAPMLFMREGQIVRLERDGTTITPLTDEQPAQADILAVVDFDVSPADGSLVYVVQGMNGNTLVRTDAEGQNRTVLMENAFVNKARWSPDGQTLALQMLADNAPAGVYLMPVDDNEPKLLQANGPHTAAVPGPEALAFDPIAWSPDGAKLLLAGYSQTVEMCSAFVKDIASGNLVAIQAPEGMVSGCASGAWSEDGNAIYIGMARPGPQPPVPGLWQADPTTGAITPFIRGEFESGEYQLVREVRPLDDGSIYAFMSSVETVPDPFSGVLTPYQMFVVGTTDSMALREDQIQLTGRALWAPDNSGAVVDMFSPTANDVVTAWIPTDGDPIVELGRFMGETKSWTNN